MRSILPLILALALAGSVAAEEHEGQTDAPTYSRPGLYIGVGGTVGFPLGWDSDVDNDLNGEATDLANDTAQANLEAIAPNATSVPLALVVDGADLEDALLGINGVIGYRVGQRVAFEIEAEWLIDSNKSDLDINGSTGSQSVKVEEIWAITANVRMYLPFDWRIQPSAVVGVGLHHSKLDIDLATSGLTTTDDGAGNIVVSADLRAQESRTKLTGALRLGGGVEIYATENVVAQIDTTYVMPFDDVGSILTTDYMSVVWRLIYRF